MGTQPRTRDHFPRMKVRGHRRRNGQRRHQQLAALIAFGSADWYTLTQATTHALAYLAETYTNFATQIAEIIATRDAEGLVISPDTSPLLTPSTTGTPALAEGTGQ